MTRPILVLIAQTLIRPAPIHAAAIHAAPIRRAVLATALLLAAPVSVEARAAAGDVPARDEVRRMVVQEAMRSDRVPPSLALAVAEAESDFVADAVSSAGARGVMQIMPATARGAFGVVADELWNPRLNIQLGVAFLGQLIERYDGRWDLALSHYNGGSRVGSGRDARVIPATRPYVDKVLTLERRHARDVAVGRLVAAAEAANAGLDRRAERQAAVARVDQRTSDRAERRRKYMALADTALDPAGDRHRIRGDRIASSALLDRIASSALLDRIAVRKARFRALLVDG
ncbi:MAG: lytic transglycosylase domain-containing protein [Thalassobaculaceae bacterium]|nr:lytic transglycosylase domain-containing protein [Thalassobaculaceae bacterium]